MSEIDNLQKADGPEKNSQSNHFNNEDQAIQTEELTSSNHIETSTEDSTPVEKEVSNGNDELLNEIDDSNAEDAEDEGNKDRHTIELKEYDNMSLEALTSELERLVKNEKVQAIKNHVEGIKKEFDSQFNDLLEEKKADFLSDGGNEIDFYFTSPIQ